jgi:DNA-binding transcriptional LysR family regulator
MKPSRYDVFLSVVGQKSITRAAAQMGYTQSAVSQILLALEAELGVTLLERSKRGVTLNSVGEELLPYIQNIANAQAALDGKMYDINNVVTGTVRIGSFTSMSCHLLPQVIHSYQAKYPNISYEVLNGNYVDVENWINSGMIDFGFLRLPVSGGLDVFPFPEEHMVVAMCDTHKYASLDPFPLIYLQNEDFILSEDGHSDKIIQYLDQHNITPNICYRVKDNYAILAFIENALGVSILPELMMRRVPYNVVGKRSNPPVYRTICVACKNKKKLSVAAKLFIEEIMRAHKKL